MVPALASFRLRLNASGNESLFSREGRETDRGDCNSFGGPPPIGLPFSRHSMLWAFFSLSSEVMI